MLSPRKLLAALLFSALLAIPSSASASDSGSALETFKARHTAVVKLVRDKAPDEALQREVDKLLNYRVLAEKSLGGAKHYAQRCQPWCSEFELALTELIRRNYLNRIRTDKSYEIEYVGEEVKEKFTKVITRVKYTSSGRPMELEAVYKMAKNSAGEWMAIDIVTDGVSLKRTYMQEFKRSYEQGGMDLVIAQLQRKLSELGVRKQ